jgi:Mg2+/Co2+ transporter CorB
LGFARSENKERIENAISEYGNVQQIVPGGDSIEEGVSGWFG